MKTKKLANRFKMVHLGNRNYLGNTTPNCPAIPVTEKKDLIVPIIAIKDGCLVITVTENQSKLWSITLTGGEDLDEVSKDAVFYQLAQRYVWLGTKKEKMDLLVEIENAFDIFVLLPIFLQLSVDKVYFF